VTIWDMTPEERWQAAQQEGVRTEAEYSKWLDSKREAVLCRLRAEIDARTLANARKVPVYDTHVWDHLSLSCKVCNITLIEFHKNQVECVKKEASS
jgi:hypothetical protein